MQHCIAVHWDIQRVLHPFLPPFFGKRDGIAASRGRENGQRAEIERSPLTFPGRCVKLSTIHRVKYHDGIMHLTGRFREPAAAVSRYRWQEAVSFPSRRRERSVQYRHTVGPVIGLGLVGVLSGPHCGQTGWYRGVIRP